MKNDAPGYIIRCSFNLLREEVRKAALENTIRPACFQG